MRHTFRYGGEETPTPGATMRLSDEDSHHLARVVRRRAGDTVEVVDGSGRLWPAIVVEPGPPSTVRVEGSPRSGPAPIPVTLAIGLMNWSRLDLVVEKATELGIERVTVFSSERSRRSASRESFDRRRSRFLRVAEAAARQAGQGHRPALGGLVAFGEVLNEIAPAEGFLCDPRGRDGLGEVIARQGPARATLMIGPDAGFADGEIAQAERAGLAICRLGGATLRAETAAIVAASVAASALGHL